MAGEIRGFKLARTGNYSAFYVAEPFSPTTLGANATKDFVYFNMLRAWKGKDSSFPFSDSHALTYSVRDGSNWETTLKPRLRERLRSSKNIILFLSADTISSKALAEEIDYGINDQGLPVIVIYPDYKTKDSLLIDNDLRQSVKNLWAKVPTFKNSMSKVPTLHIHMEKAIIEKALNNSEFKFSSKKDPGTYIYL